MNNGLFHYRVRYEYTIDFGTPRHTWVVIGAKGAVHLHISDYGEEHAAKYGDRYSGGLEIHYRTPPSYMADRAPSQDQCWALKAPCWHDGSSLQASERWIPLWACHKEDHDGMFRMLVAEARSRFEEEDRD